MFLGQTESFWIAVGGAAFIRLITAEYDGPWYMIVVRGLSMAVVAIALPFWMTAPTLHFWGLPADTYTIPVAVLWGLFGENIMRLVWRFTSDIEGIGKLFKIWRGK